MTKKAFAIGCHPDDIEFMMAGTLVLLKKAGYEIHYINVANGSCGTNKHDRDTIVKMRRGEAMDAAASAGAVFHDSIVDDLEVYYEREPLLRLGAIVREVAPDIILTHSPVDYMEDHTNTCRLAVTAAFCRGMTNFPVNPPRAVIPGNVALYHSLPHSLRDPLGKRLRAGLYTDISSVMDVKEKMLACHKSQKQWLDDSQGMDSYLIMMRELGAEVAKLTGGKFKYAEGWRRHLHLGLCAPDADPLSDALGSLVIRDEIYERSLEL
jgi:LmbE family N-acetylglucosaminyl deacetylase